MILSEEPMVHGTVVAADNSEIQILFSEGLTDDGIRILPGGESSFEWFIFIPTELHEILVDMHSEAVFDEAVLKVCELLNPR